MAVKKVNNRNSSTVTTSFSAGFDDKKGFVPLLMLLRGQGKDSLSMMAGNVLLARILNRYWVGKAGDMSLPSTKAYQRRLKGQSTAGSDGMGHRTPKKWIVSGGLMGSTTLTLNRDESASIINPAKSMQKKPTNRNEYGKFFETASMIITTSSSDENYISGVLRKVLLGGALASKDDGAAQKSIILSKIMAIRGGAVDAEGLKKIPLPKKGRPGKKDNLPF
jgi:hypothetical protein